MRLLWRRVPVHAADRDHRPLQYVFNGFDYRRTLRSSQRPGRDAECGRQPSTARYADDMRARMYEMMAKFEDPYGDVKPRNSIGEAPEDTERRDTCREENACSVSAVTALCPRLTRSDGVSAAPGHAVCRATISASSRSSWSIAGCLCANVSRSSGTCTVRQRAKWMLLCFSVRACTSAACRIIGVGSVARLMPSASCAFVERSQIFAVNLQAVAFSSEARDAQQFLIEHLRRHRRSAPPRRHPRLSYRAASGALCRSDPRRSPLPFSRQ